MQTELATQHLGRSVKGLPYQALQNMRVIKRDDGRSALISVSGLKFFSNIGTGTGGIKGLFQMDGVQNGNIIVVTSDKVYSVTKLGVVTELGDIVATNYARIAASLDQMVIVADDKAYLLDNTGVNQLLDPDLPLVTDVIYSAGLFIFSEKNSDRIWWSEVLNAAIIGTASYATAEMKPDRLRGLATVGDDIVLFGYESLEIWGQTGDITLPFAKRAGAVSGVGCYSRDSIVGFGDGSLGNRVVWLANDKTIRVSIGGDATKISSLALDQEIQGLSESELEAVRCLAWAEEGIWFILVQLPNEAWIYDVTLGLWHVRKGLNDNGIMGSVCEAWGKWYWGHKSLNTIGTMDVTYKKNLDELIPKVWTSYFPNDKGMFPIESMTLRMSLGIDDDVNTERFIWADWSDNRGNTWTSKRQRSMGKQGEYNSSIRWLPCGATKNVGRVFRFETTEPYQITVSSVVVNEVRA